MPQTLTPDVEEKDGDGGPFIRCPKCKWAPRAHDRWLCSKCGHTWNTFDTGGVCPGCRYQIEPSTLKKAHATAIVEAGRIMREETGDAKAHFAPFELHTLRHTCLTRWAPHMDPFTLGHLAGHRDMNITKRYVHPEEATVRSALEKVKAKTGLTFEHTANHVALGEMPISTATV